MRATKQNANHFKETNPTVLVLMHYYEKLCKSLDYIIAKSFCWGKVVQRHLIDVHEQQVGAFSKLRCLINIYGALGTQGQEQSKDFVVNNLVMVRFHFSVASLEAPLACSILPRQLDEDTAKVIVSCHDTDKPFYSEVCRDKWTLFGNKQYCDLSVDKFRTCILNVIVFASKVDKSIYAKIYNDTDFTDFNLCSLWGKVPVHRVILAAHSDVFRALLSKEWKEKTEGLIAIEGVTLQTLQYFKQYMYLRRLPEDGLRPLLLLKSFYLIDELKANCISSLVLNYKSGEWSSLIKFAVDNELAELMRAIMLVNPAVTLKTSKSSSEKKQKLKQ